jgi:hypothetical protein
LIGYAAAQLTAGGQVPGCKNTDPKTSYATTDPKNAAVDESIYNKLGCYNPAHDKYEKCQAWRQAEAAEEQACMARYQFWVGSLIGVFGLLGLFGTLIYTADAAKAASQSADAAKGTLIASQRAWIRRDRISFRSPLHMRDDGMVHTTVTIDFTNVGNVPALHVNEFAWLLAGEKGGGPPYDRAQSLFKKVRLQPISQGLILFAGESYPRRNGRHLQPQQGVHLIEASETLKAGEMTLYLATCINYAFSSDGSNHHQTSCLFEVRAPWFLHRDSGHIPEGQLALMEGGMGAIDTAD